MARLRHVVLCCALFALAAQARAAAGTYQIDPVHTRILFAVDHAGFSAALGTFSGARGTLQWDPEDWRGARLEVTVPLASLDLGDARWREKVLEPSFLDAARQPQARFVSSRVEPDGPGRARVSGQLTLRGITRDVTLDVRLNAHKRHPLTRRRTAGFSATAELSRADFGMRSWPNVVGDRIELRIEAEAIRTAAAAADKPTQETDDEPEE